MMSLRRWAGIAPSAGLALALIAPASTARADQEVTVSWTVAEDWGTGFQVVGEIGNLTAQELTEWSVTIPFVHTVTNVSNVVSVQDESSLILNSAPGGRLSPGQTLSFALNAISAAPVSRVPSTCTVASYGCRVVVLTDETSGSESIGEEPPGDDVVAPPADEPTSEPAPPPTDATPPDHPESSPAPTRPGDKTESPLPQPSRPSRPPQPAPAPAGAAAPTAPESNRFEVTVDVTADWGQGQAVSVTVRNDGPRAVRAWAVELDWPVAVTTMWNAESTSGGGIVRAANSPWNGELKPGQATQFGLTASPGGAFPTSESCRATGDTHVSTCSLRDPVSAGAPAFASAVD